MNAKLKISQSDKTPRGIHVVAKPIGPGLQSQLRVLLFDCLLLGLVLLLRSGLGAVGNASVIGLSAIVFGLLWPFAGFKAR